MNQGQQSPLPMPSDTLVTNPDASLPITMAEQPSSGLITPLATGPIGNISIVPQIQQQSQGMTLIPNTSDGRLPVAPVPSANAISQDEIALYDRQIRLWGMKAQEKIRNANVLLITIKALANEIAKNLVLAGIGSLTLLDDAVVTEADLGAQFLLSDVGSAEDDPVIGQNRAKAASAHLRRLNPRVKIYVDSDGIKSKGTAYFEAFDVVIATDLGPDALNIINTATHLHGRSFYAAGTHGMYGFVFCDLIEYDFVIRRDKGNVATKVGPETRTRSVVHAAESRDGEKSVETVTKRESYSTWLLASDAAGLPEYMAKSKRRLKGVTPTLSCLRALWQFLEETGGRLPNRDDTEDLKTFTTMATNKHKALHLPSETLTSVLLRKFLQNIGSEIAPVTAILGGQLAQDVINVLGQTQQPIQNMVIFDGDDMTASVFALHPDGSLGKDLLSDSMSSALIAEITANLPTTTAATVI